MIRGKNRPDIGQCIIRLNLRSVSLSKINLKSPSENWVLNGSHWSVESFVNREVQVNGTIMSVMHTNTEPHEIALSL